MSMPTSWIRNLKFVGKAATVEKIFLAKLVFRNITTAPKSQENVIFNLNKDDLRTRYVLS